jgi:hypothetical protein
MADKYYKVTNPSKIHEDIIGYRAGEGLHYFDKEKRGWVKSEFKSIKEIKEKFGANLVKKITEAEAALLFGVL